ncbi:hypothetical protein [Hymenobacter actinosclerus]|uniref:Erythromycin esterase homolog n=1 Tax=Hymenobacter actinosclerus TaxID=82805 RepID=A0A1I0EHY9_9BACT|nr:hypothetical protein [Hymenobacter actinosclerus]SET44040.1 hypothetical protein SAMN04487998_1825 [Hymenobacter actinosclerus]
MLLTSLLQTLTGRRVRLLVAGALLAVAAEARAQTPTAPADTALQRLVRTHQFALAPQGSQFGGPGWDKLRADIETSQLVLIGEDHGMAQIPGFAAAVARELKPTLYVAEIDRYQAQDLSRLAAQPGLPASFLRQHPMGLSFYSWAEEFELARQLRSQHTTILGIEQVGIAMPGRLYELLAEKVKSKPAKIYLRARATAYQARDRASMVAGGDTPGTMLWLKPAALDSLRTFTRPESPEVQRMADDFAASYQIYQAGSHRPRINLMKRNLLRELQPYQPAGQPLPKMLFKFGANHAGQGRSIWGDIYDVGNLAKNLADIHDQKTLHIFVIGKQGTQVGGQHPDDFTKNVARYSYAQEAMVLPFVTNTPAGSAWQVFDVRPLRRAMLYEGLKITTPELQATILGYDYVVIIPETTASRNF